jgi:hypothetical protein
MDMQVLCRNAAGRLRERWVEDRRERDLFRHDRTWLGTAMVRKLKTVEFWLVALPVLFAVLGWVSGFDNMHFLNHLFTPIIILWIALALFWMGREIVRRIMGWSEN